MGGDSGMQELFAQPDIKSVADLRGRIVIVDARNTADLSPVWSLT